MNKYIILIAIGIFVFSIKSHGQLEFDKPLKPDSCIEEVEIIPHYEMHPEFPGGMNSLYCYVENNLDFEYINSIDTTGKSFYMFRIDTLGIVHYDSVYRTLDLQLDLQMEKILESSPKWSPAKVNGRKVICGYTYIIRLPYKKLCRN